MELQKVYQFEEELRISQVVKYIVSICRCLVLRNGIILYIFSLGVKGLFFKSNFVNLL